MGAAVDGLAELFRRLAGDAAPSLRPLRDGTDLAETLEAMEEDTRNSVWNMQQQVSLSWARRSFHLNARSRERGLEERALYPFQDVRANPLVTTIDPTLRVGPVPFALLVADRRRVVLSPPLLGRGMDPLAWYSEDQEVALAATAAFLECWEGGLPWQAAGLRPPLPERTFAVAMLLADGSSDREIAEELGVSARTVSAEVRAIVDWLAARSRSHAVAMLVGAG